MLKTKLIFPIFLAISAISVVWGVNTESAYEVRGTSGLFSEENPPSGIITYPDFTNFLEGDIISYTFWTIDIYLENNDIVTLTNGDFAEYIEFSIPEGTPLSTSDANVDITFINPVGSNLYDYVAITVDSTDPCFYDPMDPICYTPSFSIFVNSNPTKNTYFVGESLNLEGLSADVLDNGNFYQAIQYDSANVRFESVNTFSPIMQGAILTNADTEILVIYEDDYYLGSSASFSFFITIYEEAKYTFDFVGTVFSINDASVTSTRSLETFGQSGDDWLIQSSHEDHEAVSLTKGSTGEGLIFDNAETFSAYNVSLLSKNLWGMEGMASTVSIQPIIQSVFIKAYAPNGGTAVSVAVNNENILSTNSSFLSSTEPSVNDWILFPVFDAPLSLEASVGHLEISFTNLFGGPIYLQEVRVTSTDDAGSGVDVSLLSLMEMAHEMETLDTCVDQSSFISNNQTTYDELTSNPTYDVILESLLLRDAAVAAGERNELRVIMGTKWDRMVEVSAPYLNLLNARNPLGQLMEENTVWMAWLLFSLFGLAVYSKLHMNEVS